SESVIVDEVVKDVKEKLKHIGSNGGIEDLLKNLKEELRLANRVLEDAEEKQLTDKDVREWLFNMKEVNYRADELTDKINYEELRCKLGGASESSTSFATFNKLVEDEITEILCKLVKLDAQKDKLGLKELPENRVSQRSYGAPLVRESEVYGRKDDKEAIMKLLLSDETCGDKIPVVLPIVGMGGIGKTTLAQLVYKDPRVKDQFQIRVWVTVSTEFDVWNITKQISKRVIKLQFDTDEVFELQGELSEALEGKKYLFVLDDVWNEEYLLWDELITPFKSGKSGSKIIITTRSSNVASTMSKVEAYNLNGLSDENCWKIFIQHAFGNEDLLNADPDLRKIGKGIVQKCKGLPLAVKSVAALLRSISSRDEWRKILENPIWDSKLPENARKVLPALWLSYRHLSPPPLKRCFAYCSIFPRDHEFDKQHLILLWMGEGLLEARGGTRMEDVGEEYFKILTSRSFFQPSDRVSAFPLPDDKSCFIMHDCVHDLATFVLGDFGFRLEENKNLHSLPSKTRHLSIMMRMFHDGQQFDGIPSANCLRTFLSLGYLGFSKLLMVAPLKLLMEEGCLRVLSLLGCWISELPDSIGNLKHLRYLDLSYTAIKELPDTICTLYNLETLLLKELPILTQLPTDICKLKHLRYLDVSRTRIKEIPDTVCTLYNLESLLLKECEELTRLPTNIGRLIKLRYLDFSGSSIRELPLHIFNMKDLQTIQPSFILGKEHADSTIKELGCFQNLHGWLCIEGLENVVDVKNVCEAKLRDKKFITELGLLWDGDSDDSMKEREILDQLQPHTNLKRLYFGNYPGTRFSNWMGDQSFSSIVEVGLYGCENCRSLWPLDQLPSLKTLWIQQSFRRVETINSEFFSNSSSSKRKPFRSLELLYLKGMYELKEWLFREGEVVFPTLKELVLNDCPELEMRLLPDCFPSLTKLEVRFCRQVMPFLIPATHQGLIFPSLQELVISFCGEQELILEGGLPSRLETINIDWCHNLKALDDNGFRLLTSLRKLEISYCKKLQCLPELPSYPFDLEIRNCPLLKSRCQENGEDWLKIKHTRLKLQFPPGESFHPRKPALPRKPPEEGSTSADLGAIGVAIESEVGRLGGSDLFSAQLAGHRPLVGDGFYDQAKTLQACQTENEQYCNHAYTDDKSNHGCFAKAMVVEQ
ncbi:hypothetical protein UlMin_003945, partial [Ulmus minor]